MNLKKIYGTLDLTTEYQQEIGRFNNRLAKAVLELDMNLEEHDEIFDESYYDARLLNELTFALGVTGHRIGKTYQLFGQGDTENTLKSNIFNLSVLLETLKKLKLPPYVMGNFRKRLQQVFEMQVFDLGYIFANDEVIRSEAKELDEQLVEGGLQWLETYPDSRKNFANALEHYLQKKYEDSITNAYSALEGLVKSFLGSNSRLGKKETQKNLLRCLNLPSYWGSLLRNYCEIAHEFSSRHGKRSGRAESASVSPHLARFYIYLTGSFIWLVSKVIEAQQTS